MAISIVYAGSVSSNGVLNPLLTSVYNQAAGNCIVLCTITVGVNISSINDTAGNTYISLYGSPTNGNQIWYAKNCLGNAANVITITYSATPSNSFAFYYDVSGVSTAAPLDTIITADTSASGTPRQTSYFATNYANEAAIFMGTSTSGYKTYTVGDVRNFNQLTSSTLTSGTIPASFTTLAGTWASDATEGAYASAVDGNSMAALYDNVQIWGNDQYSEGAWASASDGSDANHIVGPAVRISTSADTFYFVGHYGGYNVLYKCVSGTVTQLSYGTSSYVQGTICRLAVVGTNLYVYENGVILYSLSDASISSGKAGLAGKGVGSSTTLTFKNWAAGNATVQDLTLDGTAGQGGIQGCVESGVLSAQLSNAIATLTTTTGLTFVGATFDAQSTYTISGTILDGSSNPIVGATVACTGQTSTTTASDGTYSFAAASGSVTVTPTLTEWTFSPTSRSISGATSSANFTGTETLYSISGALGAGGAGATVSWTAAGVFQTELGGWFLLEGGGFILLEGTSGSVTADGSGNYTIPNLANDTYQIIPTKTGYTFSPTSANETVSGANITGVNFTATASSGTAAGNSFLRIRRSKRIYAR